MPRPILDAGIAALCPPLTEDELAGLRESLKAEGCRDALVVWAETGILLDGHNRLAICEAEGIRYRTVGLSFADRDAAKAWVLRNQLGRRNLSPDAASLLRGRLYNLQKLSKAEAGAIGGISKYQNDTCLPESTADRLSAELGVSAPTIKRDGAFAGAVERLEPHIPEIVQQVMAGGAPSRKAVIEAAREPETAAAKLAHVAHNSGNNEWYTPPEYAEAARAVMGGIDLDPASTPVANRVIGAERFYTAEDNGLEQPWAGRIWMNPPYSQPLIGLFTQRLADAYKAGQVEQACVLVNNATETQWFQTLLEVCSAACFIRGRVRFLDASGNPCGAPLQGQAVAYIGEEAQKFAEHFRRFGPVLYA